MYCETEETIVNHSFDIHSGYLIQCITFLSATKCFII